MTVVEFPPTPSAQSVAEIAARATATYPKWDVQCFTSDDGQPYLALEHRSEGTTLGLHWKRGNWALLDERWVVLAEGRDLWTLVQGAVRQ